MSNLAKSAALLLFSNCVNGDNSDVPFLSIAHLVTGGAQHHGSVVHVYGYLLLGVETSAICLSKEPASPKDCVWLSSNAETSEAVAGLNYQLVSVTGQFDAHHQGHLDLFSGSITVDSIRKAPRWHPTSDS